MDFKLLTLIILSLLSLGILIFTKTERTSREGYRPLDVGKGPYGNPLIQDWRRPRRGWGRRRWRYPYLYSPKPTWVPGGYYGCPLRDGCIINL